MCKPCLEYCNCSCSDPDGNRIGPKCPNRRQPLACPCKRSAGRVILLSNQSLPEATPPDICPEEHPWVRDR
jgi:hypothetical protein